MCDPQCRAARRMAPPFRVHLHRVIRLHRKTSFRFALEATQDVIAQLLAERGDTGIDTKRLAVGGDSAGANIATVAHACDAQ